MRRTIMRGLVLVGIGTLGLTGTGSLAGAATGGGLGSPDSTYWHGPSPGSALPTTPDDTPSSPSATPSPSKSPSQSPSQSLSQSASGTGSPSPSRTRTATPTSSPEPARVRLHAALIGATTTGTDAARARYTVRVKASGGMAHRVVATVAVHPHGARFAGPAACHGGAKQRCRLGDVHHAHRLTFRERPGHAAHRLRIEVTVTSANAPTTTSTMVLVVRRTPAHTVREAAPPYVPPQTITQRELTTVAAPQPPAATIFSTPDGAQAPLGPPDAARAAPDKPRLPVIAPRPGPRPTPNGAPVTVRPVADGHAIKGAASGMPTRTIFGLLAAASSFVGLVTALVLIRRRNEA